MQHPEEALEVTKYVVDRSTLPSVLDTSAFGYDLEPLEEQLRNKKSKGRIGSLFAKMQTAISESDGEE